MITITKHCPPLQKITVEFADEEWAVIKKYLIEDSFEFHKAVLVDLNEFAADLPEELGTDINRKAFFQHKELFKKLQQLGIDTKGVERYENKN